MKSYQKTTIEQAAKLLSSKQRIALFAHKNPDGDTIGASVALRLALEKLGKAVTVFCESTLSASILKFSRYAEIKHRAEGKFDLLVAVDCADLLRIGDDAAFYDAANETLTIDHHGGDYFSKYNCLYPYASCCQIVYAIIKFLGVNIDAELATYLYMGICTDTGNFAHSNTDSVVFTAAAELSDLGADKEKVYRSFFCDTTFAENKLYGLALSRIRSYYDGQMALLYVTKEDLDSLSLDSSATSGLVQFAINIVTAKVGVCIVEYARNIYKVSMRGKNFDVREVCKHFGGGGHILASGCMINGLLEDVIEKIVRVVGFTI